MELNPVHYFINKKNAHHGEAIAKGFDAEKVSPDRLQSGCLHLIGGLQHGSLGLMKQVRSHGEPYVFFDRAYFNGGPGSNRLRVVPGEYQKNWITMDEPDRFQRTGVQLKPWRQDGKHIMLVPPANDAIKDLFGIHKWQANTLHRLAGCTDRPIMVSVKGDPRPLAERLKDCWCVVTWTSNVAVEAICAGIPAFVSRHSAAAPVAGPLDQLEYLIDSPPMPYRDRWAWSLAYGEFSVDEIASGYASSIVMNQVTA